MSHKNFENKAYASKVYNIYNKHSAHGITCISPNDVGPRVWASLIDDVGERIFNYILYFKS